MTDEEKSVELALRISKLVSSTCIDLKIQPYDAVEVMVKSVMVLSLMAAKDGRKPDVVLDVIGMVWEVGTQMIDAEREGENHESSMQRRH
jgi:hypothetical protein